MKLKNKEKCISYINHLIFYLYLFHFTKRKIEKIIEKFTNKEKTDSFLSILNFPSTVGPMNNEKQNNLPLKKNLSHSKTTPIDDPVFSTEKQKKRDKPTKNDQFEIIVGEEDINVEEFNSNSSRK